MEIYSNDESTIEAIGNAKLLIEDEHKFVKKAQQGESPESSGVENTSKNNLLSTFPNPFNP
ncbi:hypothetical protein H8E88_10170 [candidate division KSB1 bacterium]|nr:hypothetical protein [candidate division KSB1 bacterium]